MDGGTKCISDFSPDQWDHREAAPQIKKEIKRRMHGKLRESKMRRRACSSTPRSKTYPGPLAAELQNINTEMEDERTRAI